MSQQKNEAALSETFTESAIADYLRSHPDFFERHTPLLLRLRLPHPTNGFTVSLVERQVSMLRQRNGELERQLKDLIAVAKVNDSLIEKIHRLSIRLMAAESWDERLEQLETSLREDFGAERAALVLFGTEESPAVRDGFVWKLRRDDPLLRPFLTFLQAARPRCGPMRERQRAALFERDAESVGSAAMLPLGPEASVGFLVVANRDPSHFHPGQRMDFLVRIGELIATALAAPQASRAAV
ncbi:MAG TPA: DUF484 family protein [Gammaproteobacteria bacterium]